MASSIPDAASYNYEEYDEYLLIQEAAPAPCTSTKEIIPEQIFEPHAQGVEKSMQKTLGGSQDSGYEGKLRSPEMKPAKTAVAEVRHLASYLLTTLLCPTSEYRTPL